VGKHDGGRRLEGQGKAPPSPACCGRAPAAQVLCLVLIDKKGEGVNPLKSIEAKRQLLSEDRQYPSGDRQKPLVLLS
jgi:hypothetical protein